MTMQGRWLSIPQIRTKTRPELPSKSAQGFTATMRPIAPSWPVVVLNIVSTAHGATTSRPLSDSSELLEIPAMSLRIRTV